MGKSTPTPPPAPDPTAVSAAQSAANIASAQAQQKLNMVGTQGPQGTVNYVADETQPGGYRQVTTLSGPEQQSYDLSKQAENSAYGLANTEIGRVGDALGRTLDTNGLPDLLGGVNRGSIQTQIGDAGQIQRSFNQGQQVQGHVGPADLNAAAQQAQNAAYGQAASRLDPMWSQREDQLQTRLANQGFGMNSTGTQNAQDQLGRDRNDAYNQAAYSAIGAGNDAAQQLFNQSLQQGAFANQAAGQEYQQNMGAAQFGNTAQQQQYGQNLTAMQAQNAAQNQDYQQAYNNAQLNNTARNQGLQERAYLQNQPLNQFNALMSSGQVGMPQGIQYTPSQVANTDVLGAYALNQQAQQSAYDSQLKNSQASMSGLFGLGNAALGAAGAAGGFAPLLAMSDERLKTDKRRVGTLDNGVPVWSYRMKSGGPPMIGVMAHELAQVRPDAVHNVGGYLAVDYAAI